MRAGTSAVAIIASEIKSWRTVAEEAARSIDTGVGAGGVTLTLVII